MSANDPRFRSKPCATRRQRHRFHYHGADDYRQAAGAAQGDCAAQQPGRLVVQSGNGAVCKYLPQPVQAAAASLGLEPIAATVHDRAELDTVIAAQAREPNRGLIVIPDGFLNVHRADIIALAARYRLPTIYPWRFFAEQGGLLSYGSEQRDFFRLAAIYVNRILKGEKPADLPAQAPTEYKLVINLKTANALGLVVPPALLDRADKVIE
ncbi:MAG: ABC transporter substrate-binding protein [Pseudolabrys sp.]